MKFPYLVKHNGVYYPIGTDVPIEEGGGMNTPAESSGKVDEPVEPEGSKYSEDDLNLPYMKLKALAKKEGLKVPNTAKAEEIKEMLRGIV